MVLSHEKENPKYSTSMDKFGILVASLCAAHCLFLPVLLSSLPLLEGTSLNNEDHSDEWLHWLFIALSIYFAGASLGKGYLRHKNLTIFCLAILGPTFLIASLLPMPYFSNKFIESESFFVILGSLCLSIAHICNWKIMKSISSCSKDTGYILNQKTDCCPKT